MTGQIHESPAPTAPARPRPARGGGVAALRPAPQPRRRDAVQRREALLNAAATCFETRGYSVFFGGGSFKIEVGRERGADLWERARDIYREMAGKMEQELLAIPGKYRFCEMLKPPSEHKLNAIVRLGDALSRNGNWNQFSFSNLGPIDLLEAQAPFRLEDFTLSVRSFGVRPLGLVAFALHGRLRFVFIGEEQCMSAAQVDTLEQAFMGVLREQAAHRRREVEPAVTLAVD